jgi:putative transposase
MGDQRRPEFALETPLANLSEFMRRFNITYTSYYNRRHKRVGHLYQGRYKSILVDKESYLAILSRYIHLNPVRTRRIGRASLAEKRRYLKRYKWSSLLGYIDETKRSSFIDYSMILEGYGGDNNKARGAYWEAIGNDLSKGMDIKKEIVGQSILGSDKFIKWVKDKFLGKETREIPSVKKILGYRAEEEIIRAICEETGKGFDEIIKESGATRAMAMELLYRMGGLKGVEIGGMMGVDYSTVSQGRRRLKEKLVKDKNFSLLMDRIERRLSRIKI